jgi:hypothetical protein
VRAPLIDKGGVGLLIESDAMRSAVAVLTLAIFAAPVSPLFGQQAPDIVVKGERPEKKVCRTYEAPTGSRVGERRVCKTQSEWRLAEQSAQRAVDSENRRFEANRAQLENEKTAFAKPLPH